ncbi:hypothetical protein C8R46DRAFT_1057809 [Mycena filopes]|nr:hypothetical protein C8R46DRAFT_1057809 [Mycena filopes]
MATQQEPSLAEPQLSPSDLPKTMSDYPPHREGLRVLIEPRSPPHLRVLDDTDYVAVPGKIRLTSHANQWLINWGGKHQLAWDGSSGASKYDSVWEAIPDGYANGHSFYRLKARDGTFLWYFEASPNGYDSWLGLSTRPDHENATSWEVIPVNKELNIFYLRAWTAYTPYISTYPSENYEYRIVGTPQPGPMNEITISEPIGHKEIFDIKYELDGGEISDTNPYVAIDVWVDNKSDITQTKTIKHVVKSSNTSSWSNKVGATIGVKVKFSAGIPFIGGSETEVSVGASYERVWGESNTEETSIEIDEVVTVPPKSRMHANVVGTQSILTVPFTYKERLFYDTQTESTVHERKGEFTGVQHYNFHYTIEKVEPLPGRRSHKEIDG